MVNDPIVVYITVVRTVQNRHGTLKDSRNRHLISARFNKQPPVYQKVTSVSSSSSLPDSRVSVVYLFE